MNIYKSKTWISDLNVIIAKLPELEELAGKSVMVTGCTGLICSAVVDVLIQFNETHETKIQILAAGRMESKVIERFTPYYRENWFKFILYDATSTRNKLTAQCDYIIHGASNASPNKIVKEPVETMLSNIVGTECLLDYAKQVQAKRFLYISSSEVYGKKEVNKPSKETEYGGIDLLNIRSSYSLGKCAAETMCVSYYDEYDIDTVIVRPGHIYGPTATLTDNRVSSIWVYNAAQGENIVMKSDGAQIRSYCYCLDCASAILKILMKGKTAHAYNISNPNSIISIYKLAEILSKFAGMDLKSEAPTLLEKKGFNLMSDSSLDSTELLGLGWKGLFDAERGLKHTIEIIKEMTVVGD